MRVGPGSVVPFQAHGATIDIADALIRHRDPAVPVARGTVVFNPGGPGGDVIAGAAGWTKLFAGLLSDHDVC